MTDVTRKRPRAATPRPVVADGESPYAAAVRWEARLAEAERLLAWAEQHLSGQWPETTCIRAFLASAPEQPPDWKEIGHTYGLTPPATGGLDLADAMAYAYKCGLQDEVDNWNVSDERLAEIGRNLRDAFLDAPAAAEGIEIPDHGDEAVPEWDEPICGEKGPGLDNGMYDALCMLPPNHEGEHQHGSVRWQP